MFLVPVSLYLEQYSAHHYPIEDRVELRLLPLGKPPKERFAYWASVSVVTDATRPPLASTI